MTPALKRHRTEPAIVDVVQASSTEVFRATATYFTRLDALRQTAGGPFRPPGGPVAVAARPPNFTGLEHYGGRSARTHARWFGRPFPFARLAVAALGAVHPRVPEGLGELLVLDTSFVSKSGGGTWGTSWFWSGMARAVRWGMEAVAAGAGEILKARWVAVDGGYASRTFVEGVRALDLHTVGRLRKDAVLRFPDTGPHERRPGRCRQFDGRFDRRDLTCLACTTLDDEQVDLHHGVLHGKAWQCWLRMVYCPAGPTRRRRRGCSCTAPMPSWHRNASGCAHPLSNRSRSASEHHPSISLAIRFRSQNCPNHRLHESNSPGQSPGLFQLDRLPGGFKSNGHGYMASEPPSPSGHGPEPLRVSAMSNFTSTGFVQMRIVASLLVRCSRGYFNWLLR